MASLDMEKIGDIEVKDLEALAGAAEGGERYEDMCKFMNAVISKVCKSNNQASTDQRNMLSVAFKNVVGGKRQSMRSLKELLENAKPEDDMSLTKSYLKLVEREVIDVCNQVLNVVVEGPLAQEASDDGESKVFWLKMCGDYCRYLAEISDNEDALVKMSGNDDGKKPASEAEEYYKQAYAEAEKSLPETHPTRLGLALNYSVCFYEILNKKEEACKLAKEAFDAAIEKLDTLNDKSYKDSTLIMQLLRDNLTLWTQSKDEEAA